MSEINASEYLTPDEVRQLTGSTWKSRQRKHLDKLGYPYETAADGSPLVSRWYARNRACGVQVAMPSGPRLEFVR